MRRTLLTGAVIGAFLSFTGAYDSASLPLVPRTLYMEAVSLSASLLGLAVFTTTGRGPLARRWWTHGLAAGAIMTVPMALVVWLALQAVTRPGPPLQAALYLLPTSAATSVFFCLWVACQGRRREAARARRAAAAPGPAKFLERLPPRLRGAELWAVAAEDHYLRLHTSKGQDLILMRLSDALKELQGLDGAQVHRSWWVARAAVADARRGDGRATLTLKDGAQAPVSRTFARQLRADGWI